jgi:hypothetical protein
MFFHNKLESSHLKNTHKKQRSDGLYRGFHGFLFTTKARRTTKKNNDIVIPAKAGILD